MNYREKRLKTIMLILFLLLLLLITVVLGIGFFRGNFVSEKAMQAYIGSLGIWAPLALTAVQTMQAFLPIIPSFFGFATGAGLFGAWGGFLCNYIGICLGSIIAYALARRLGISFVQQIVSPRKYQKAVRWASTGHSYTLMFFLAILLPLAPDCALCYFSGLVEMPVKKYVAILVTAKPWCILLYSVLFSYIL